MHIIHDVPTRYVTRHQRIVDVHGVMLVYVCAGGIRGRYWVLAGCLGVIGDRLVGWCYAGMRWDADG
jgi:hypothetical protein